MEDEMLVTVTDVCMLLFQGGQAMFYFQKKTFKRADQMDIFSKQYMWRIKGGHGALNMFLTHRFYS